MGRRSHFPHSSRRSDSAQVSPLVKPPLQQSNRPSLTYPDLSKHFRVPFLSSRRAQHDLLFLKGLFSEKLNSEILLSRFPLRVPIRPTRTAALFAESRARISTVQNGLVCRVARETNSFLAHSKDDFFTTSFSAIDSRTELCTTDDVFLRLAAPT